MRGDALPSIDPALRQPSRRALRGLDLLNVTLADVRDGLGPYLAIYLLAVRGPEQGWNEATIGLVMTIAGIAGLLAQTPAGALIDRTNAKRSVVIAAAVVVTVSCLVLPWISNFTLVAATQALASMAGSIFAPALTGITLGIVGPKLFSKRIGRNEGFNHAGNAVSAMLAGGLAYVFGPIVVFWLMGLLAACSIVAMLMVPAVGCSRPATQRKVVVLPQPEGPSSTTISPAGTAKLTPSTAGRPIVNCLRRSVTSRVAVMTSRLCLYVHLRVGHCR